MINPEIKSKIVRLLKDLTKKFIFFLFDEQIGRQVVKKMSKLLKERKFYTIDSFIWRHKYNFINQPKTVDIVWAKVNTIGTITVSLEIMRALLHTNKGLRIMALENTPHYKWIKDIISGKDDFISRSLYYDYIKNFFPNENTESQLKKIKKMALSYKNQSEESVYEIVSFPPARNENFNYRVIIFDGNHRVAIAKALGHKSLKCYLVNQTIDYKKYI